MEIGAKKTWAAADNKICPVPARVRSSVPTDTRHINISRRMATHATGGCGEAKFSDDIINERVVTSISAAIEMFRDVQIERCPLQIPSPPFARCRRSFLPRTDRDTDDADSDAGLRKYHSRRRLKRMGCKGEEGGENGRKRKGT